ncbi:hypothetical protein [Larkinella sp. VNQ87]|uniref:hypothetical protein n=1 Tax=Larkinella sp. VNQ87 TaxID=3400921 RepID=UPI003C2E62CC
MRNWKLKNPYWGCVNSPEFQKLFLDQSRKLIDLEAYGLFVDDARFNDQATEWGGCFCDHCVSGFTTYLQDNGADTLSSTFNYRDYLRSAGIDSLPAKNRQVPLWTLYRAFQTKSVIRFLTSWRKSVENYARRPVTFLTNNYGGQWTGIYQIFDIGVAELPENRLNRDYILARTSEAGRLNKKQYFTLSSDDESKQLKALFLTYSANSALIIPWDVHVPGKSQKSATRFLGKNQTFQPVYKLLREDESKFSQAVIKSNQTRRATPLQIVSKSKADSLHIQSYDLERYKIIMIEGNNRLKSHIITIQAGKTIKLEDIKILFPNPNIVQVRKEEHNYKVEFSNELIIFSLKK